MRGTDRFEPALDELLLDPDDWAPPRRLSADECFDEIGADWRSSADSSLMGDE